MNDDKLLALDDKTETAKQWATVGGGSGYRGTDQVNWKWRRVLGTLVMVRVQ